VFKSSGAKVAPAYIAKSVLNEVCYNEAAV